MKSLDVHIRAKDRRNFMRRALARYHQKPSVEYVEAIILRQAVGQFHIERFEKLKGLETGVDKDGRQFIAYDDVYFYDLKKKAATEGFLIGTIHSHTDGGDSSGSVTDHVEAAKSGEALIGVLEISKNKAGKLETNLDFWVPQMPCRINIIRE